VIETGVNEFKIGVENELFQRPAFQEMIERLRKT
jgi:hypothetical protein